MKYLKARIGATFLGIAISTSAWAQSEGAKWLTPPSLGYVSVTFDDATQSQFEEAFPILSAVGIPATLYVNTKVVDVADPFFMSWDEIRLVFKAGWEIGSHTVTHPALTNMEDVEIVGELALSRDRIEAEIGSPPKAFASPFGEYDEQILAHVARYYRSHVRAWGDKDGINPLNVDPFLIERVNIDESLTAEAVCSMVQAVESGEWLVLMFHQVTGPAGGPYTISPEQFQNIAQCIHETMQKGNLIADTVSAVLIQIKKE